MKTFPLMKAKLFAALLVTLTIGSNGIAGDACRAQGPDGRSFGFGLVVFDPLGATIKIWTNPVNAFTFDIGESDFGPTRIDGDYLWHFDAFNSRAVKLFAGPGLCLAFGDGNGIYGGREFDNGDNSIGLAARVMFGVNFIPERTPLEIFFELGPIIGLSPSGVGLDLAAGIRFYP
jgi:hypothetical protein